jgi:hypothetical protein
MLDEILLASVLSDIAPPSFGSDSISDTIYDSRLQMVAAGLILTASIIAAGLYVLRSKSRVPSGEESNDRSGSDS